MSFQQELESLCAEVPGTRFAVVMSLDGISVANHQQREGSVDMEEMLIEMISPLKQAKGAMQAVQAGALASLEVATKQGTLLFKVLNDEHFLALMIEPDGLVGRGRFAMRQHDLALRKEFL